ncbi:MAG: hypothetical protein AB8B56_05600 [Crocinitomicaceae bacterium]
MQEELIHQIQLLVDFGLVVLIWMVQLIVYPGFLHYSKHELHKWHQFYTIRIAVIVIPLMLAQLTIGVWGAFRSISVESITYLSLVLFLWIHTFLVFAPRHQKIANNTFDEQLLSELVAKNWIRTFVWTLICTLHIFFMCF